jgi:hypothetical protein
VKIETRKAVAAPTGSDVAAVEIAIGTKFPSDYVDFIQGNNGAYFSDNVFDIPGGNHSGISQVIPFDKVLYEKSLIDQTGDFGYFPVAYAEGGNYVCLATRGSEVGKIYFCDHEVAGKEAFLLLAQSLTEFLDSLKPFSPADIEPTQEQKEKGRVWIDPDFLKKINDGE